MDEPRIGCRNWLSLMYINNEGQYIDIQRGPTLWQWKQETSLLIDVLQFT
jgi:hypothetical protein